MAKKVNLGSITMNTLEVLSNYNYALQMKDTIMDSFNLETSQYTSQLKVIEENRQKAQEEGMSLDEAASMYSRVDIDKAFSLIETAKKDANRVLNGYITTARKLVSDNVYEAYKKYMDNGEASDYAKVLINFLNELGISTPEVATGKLAEKLVARVSGMKKAGKNDRKKGNKRVVNKSINTIKDLFLCTYIELCVEEKGVLDEDEYGNLSKHDFQAEAAA